MANMAGFEDREPPAESGACEPVRRDGDTIAAIATPTGVGGIGIVRISGPGAEGILRRIFRPREGLPVLDSHRLRHGNIVDPGDGRIIDEVLAVLMRNPRSYTGEDTAEINCHGGPLILRRVLEAAIRQGARPARPGEFTERAFLNGRMDLSQAEAVQDMIAARTARSADIALAHLQGGLGRKIRRIRDGIQNVRVSLEASIDFGDEMSDADPLPETTGRLAGLAREMRDLLATYASGRLHREGARVVIAGKPNVGKSSLLNRLLGTERAIVTPVPGTTRDFIEESLDLDGLPVALTDTAGIRAPENPVEEKGIALAMRRMAAADAVLAVFDGSEALTEEDREVALQVRERPHLIVVNKSDLPRRWDDEIVTSLFPEKPSPPLRISAKHGDGLRELRTRLRRRLTDADIAPHDLVLTNDRHRTALEGAFERLGDARAALSGGRSPELASLDLKEAMDRLGEITGETVSGDLLARIFSRFCIGK